VISEVEGDNTRRAERLQFYVVEGFDTGEMAFNNNVLEFIA
jgi:hypothetical protein